MILAEDVARIGGAQDDRRVGAARRATHCDDIGKGFYFSGPGIHGTDQ